MSSDRVEPPRTSGLMLGEILGRRAGETCTELTLPLFLLPRAASLGVFRTEADEFRALIWGLEVDAGAPGRAKAGEGKELKFGVAVVDSIVGVTCPLECVSSRANCGLAGLAGSGKLKPSIA